MQEEKSLLDPALPAEDPERERLDKEIEVQVRQELPLSTRSPEGIEIEFREADVSCCRPRHLLKKLGGGVHDRSGVARGKTSDVALSARCKTTSRVKGRLCR